MRRLQARTKSPPEAGHAGTLILHFQTPKPWENKFPFFKPFPFYGILLWQPEPTKKPMRMSNWPWRKPPFYTSHSLYFHVSSMRPGHMPLLLVAPESSHYLEPSGCMYLLNWIKLNAHVSSVIFESSSKSSSKLRVRHCVSFPRKGTTLRYDWRNKSREP